MNESIGELLFIAHSTLLSESIDVGETTNYVQIGIKLRIRLCHSRAYYKTHVMKGVLLSRVESRKE